MNRALFVAAALVLAACQPDAAPPPAAAPVPAPPAPPEPAEPAPQAPPPAEQASDDWRKYAKPEDADRLARLDGAWEKAREAVRGKGQAAELARLGALADPSVALPNPHPAPGAYRCRTVKLGLRAGLIAYPFFRCEVELTPGGDLILRKLTGSQRTEGMLYPGEGDGLVYLGGQAWGMDEAAASRYGADPMRDQIGRWERIGEQRWRLALPWPRVDSDLDLMEIVR